MRKRLGEILIESGSVTSDQLEKAVRIQSQLGVPLGEALVRGGFVSEEAVAAALSKQLGIPYASRENQVLRPELHQGLERLVPEEFCRSHLVLPLFLQEQTLAAAMADPTDILSLDNLRLISGKVIQPFIATKTQILATLDELYHGNAKNLVEKTLEKPSDSDEETVLESPAALGEERLDLDKVMALAKGAQVVQFVNLILKQAVLQRASDIHLEPMEDSGVLRFRVDGALYERTPPPKELLPAVTSRVKILSRLDIAERRLPQDGSFSMKLQNRVIEVRVSTLPTVYGEKVVLRILDKGSVQLDVDRLGFDPPQLDAFLKAAKHPYGLIFLTGPTGSGKTTTLYSVLERIKTPEKNFLTIEDPVEYHLRGINQVQVKPQIGLTFANAIRAFLRQDPDVLLVGEVRDQETAQICLRAALTGHLVLSTLHTNDALGAVTRLVDLGIEPFLVSNTLVLVGAQRLVRTLCAHCKKSVSPDPQLLDRCLREAGLESLPAQPLFYQPRGCEQCARTGYRGRIGVFEVYFLNEAMREAIHLGKGEQELREVAQKSGMMDLRANAWRKVLAGITSAEEVLAVTLRAG
ncbi:MAG: Flp pilus assembly complex ATPase component TadA [Elusimicrobia bacterium]|nr:Flp pilus assembly complex ATPase component TadA [Elusimicrobiota bacterium]